MILVAFTDSKTNEFPTIIAYQQTISSNIASVLAWCFFGASIQYQPGE